MSDGLRVLHLMVSDRFAGVEQFVMRLALQQAHDGHEVWVAGGDPQILAAPLRAAGIRFAPIASVREAVRATRAADVDVVNSHMTAADVAAVTARLLDSGDRALVSTRHFALPRGSRGPRALYRGVERLLDAEIAISHAVADTIHVPSTVVHSGMETPRLTGERRARTVLMAQRLQPEKQTDLGIRAFAESGIAADGWSLHIAGIGPLRADLADLALRLGIDDAVRFLGFRDDLPTLLQRSGILLATTPNEGLGLTVLEAMAAALPVVAADAGGHRDLLADLKGARLFRAGDAAAAGRQLRELASDADERARLGAAERRVQETAFTLRAQADGTAAVYRQTLRAREAHR